MAVTRDNALGSVTISVTASGAQTALVTSAAAAAGSRIVVCVSWFDINNAAVTLSDGTAYTKDKQVDNGGDHYAVFSRVAAGGLASSSSITATVATGTGGGGMFVMACSYLGTTGVDTSGQATGTTSASWSSGSASNTVADALYVGGSGADGTITSESSTATNGTERFDLFLGSQNQAAVMQDLIVSSIASQALTGTWANTTGLTSSTGALVIYKGTATAATATPPIRARVLMRGVRDRIAMRLYARTPPALATGFTFTDAVTGALIFGGTVEEGWTWAFPQQSHPRRLPIARGLRDRVGMRGYARTPSALRYTYTDTAAGAWVFVSSPVEAKRGTDAGSGAWIFAGSRVEAKRGTDARSGTLIFAGSRTEAATFVQARSGALIFGGARTELKRGTDAQTGLVIFGGSRTELKRYGDVRAGTVTFGGSATQLRVGTDARTGVLIFGGHSSTAVTTATRAKVTFIIPDARGRRRRTRW